MKEHEGYNPAEMPHRESDHAGAAFSKTTAMRATDTSPGLRPAPHARPGEPVKIWVDVIRSDKRGEWERLLHELLGPAALRREPEAMRHIRVLEPEAADPDGTWTYVIMPDPYDERVDYETRPYVEGAFGAAQADEFARLWDECHARPQYEIALRESAW